MFQSKLQSKPLTLKVSIYLFIVRRKTIDSQLDWAAQLDSYKIKQIRQTSCRRIIVPRKYFQFDSNAEQMLPNHILF